MVLFYACNTDTGKEDKPYPELQLIISEVQQKYVPDSRDDVFDIEIKDVNGIPVAKGYTTVPEAYQEFLDLATKQNTKLTDSIKPLPDADLDGKIYAVTNLSVANIRTKGAYSAEMATQTLLGMPLKILHKGGWWRVQTAEGYIGWTMAASFHPMTKEEFNAWNTAPKIVFTDYYGFAYEKADEKSQRVSDLVACNMLKYEGDAERFYKVSYPDARVGYVLKTQSKLYDQWLASIELTEKSLLEKAFTSMGIPYLWGGTSAKGMDCSGFTKTTLFMHGIILRRDASQQVHTGTPIDIASGYDNLRPGDLMFFGKEAEGDKKMRIRHVGFYIGNKEFIHAAGRVKVNSLDPNAPNYDEPNTKEFIRASRVIGAVDTKGIWSIKNNPLYQVQE
jgi:hypothetical protein